MRKTFIATVALLGFTVGGTALALADTMQRDGDHSGRLGDPVYLQTGRSIAQDRFNSTQPYSYSDRISGRADRTAH